MRVVSLPGLCVVCVCAVCYATHLEVWFERLVAVVVLGQVLLQRQTLQHLGLKGVCEFECVCPSLAHPHLVVLLQRRVVEGQLTGEGFGRQRQLLDHSLGG